jgi:hypothetical protein
MTTPTTTRKTTWKPAPPTIDPLYWLPSLSRKAEEYPAELLAARRAEFIARIKQINSDAILERAEQSDLEWRTREPDGSDTSMSAQLDEAGYGSGGVL